LETRHRTQFGGQETLRHLGQAVTGAGFELAHQTWTREIQAWHQAGVRVSSISRQNPRLTVAAIRLIGGWHDALAAAGLDVRKKHQKTKE